MLSIFELRTMQGLVDIRFDQFEGNKTLKYAFGFQSKCKCFTGVSTTLSAIFLRRLRGCMGFCECGYNITLVFAQHFSYHFINT
jgi:hypothetical protein